MRILRQLMLLPALLVPALLVLPASGHADSLTITYNLAQNQTAVVSATTFTEIVFTGSVTNNTAAPITFELSGFADPFEPYIASYQNGIGFPGITLGPGASTGTIDLAIVTLQLFDPHLGYPAFVTIVLPATDSTGRIFTENDASIQIVTSIPEPSALLLLSIPLLWLGLILRKQKIGTRKDFAESVS